jgi:aryl-alcohol dehydrogenase-like predicted oxidoreductase
MEQVFFGRTGMKVSRFGLGTMSFGGDADRDTSRALFTRARDAGVTLFDFEVAELFVAIADELGVHPVTLAVAWVGRHPAVTAPLVGARDLAQLEPALAAAELELDDALHARSCAISPTPPPATDRDEEASHHDYATVLRR